MCDLLVHVLAHKSGSMPKVKEALLVAAGRCCHCALYTLLVSHIYFTHLVPLQKRNFLSSYPESFLTDKNNSLPNDLVLIKAAVVGMLQITSSIMSAHVNVA